jgi:hypothetical protein
MTTDAPDELPRAAEGDPGGTTPSSEASGKTDSAAEAFDANAYGPALQDALKRLESLGSHIDASSATEFRSGVFVKGDFVLGGKRAQKESAESDIVLVLSRPRPLARPPFVEPAYFGEVLDKLQAHNIVCLRGPEHSGRRTVIVRALSDLQLQPAEVDPRLTLARITDATIPRSTGLIFDQSASPRMAVDDYQLDRLEEKLRETGSKIVAILGPSSTVAVADRLVVIPATGPAPIHDIVSAWMAHFHKGSELDWATGDQVRQRLIAEGVSLGTADAVSLARLAVHSTAGDCIGNALDQLAHGRQDRVADLVAGCLGPAEIGDWALFIATLVLSGCPESTIVMAAKRLEESLVTLFPEGPVSKAPFSRTLTARLAQLELRRLSASEGTPSTLGRTTLSLRDPSLSERILQHVWFEHGLEATLNQWLTGLAYRFSPDVTVEVATAAAQLLGRGAATILGEIVGPWSASESAAVRFAASVCLGLAASALQADAQDVLTTLDSLARSHDWRQRWTAATCVGLGVGERFPLVALGVLDHASADDIDLVRAQAVFGLRGMMEPVTGGAGWPERIELLSWWLDDANRGLPRRAAAGHALQDSLSESSADLSGHPRAMIEISALVGTLLDHKDSRNGAGKLLRIALKKLSLPGDKPSIDELVDNLCVGDRGRGRLTFLLRGLQRSNDDQVISAASHLLAEMEAVA